MEWIAQKDQAIVNQAVRQRPPTIEKYDSVNPAALKRLIAVGAEPRAFPQPVMAPAIRPRRNI